MTARTPSWAAVLLLPALLFPALPAGAAAPGPASPSPARQAKLAELVAEDCGACHGLTRKGGLGPPLLPGALAGLNDQAVAATILDGRPDTPMPPWRGLLSEDDATWIARLLKGETHVP